MILTDSRLREAGFAVSKSFSQNLLTAVVDASSVLSIRNTAATKELDMETTTRYIVQIFIEGKGWVAYVAKGSRKTGRYTLTPQEAFAYL